MCLRGWDDSSERFLERNEGRKGLANTVLMILDPDCRLLRSGPFNGPNEFPLAQSEGLAPQSPPVSNPAVQAGLSPQATETLTYNAPASTAKPGEATPAPVATPAATAGGSPLAPAVTPPAEEKKQGVFARLGRFFRKIFGAE